MKLPNSDSHIEISRRMSDFIRQSLFLIKRPLFTLFVCLLCPVSFNSYAFTQEECIQCHRKESGKSFLQISIVEFQHSIHGNEITCGDCHSGIESKEHERVKGSGAVDCGQCHEQENRHGLGTERDDRPACHSCHGKHGILGKDKMISMAHREKLKNTCSKCHPVECGEIGFLSRLLSLQIRSHKKQDFSRDYRRTNCIGCHQGQAAHGEKKPIDTQDCHICHMSLKGHLPITVYIHPRADYEKQPAIFIAAAIYPIFIIFILWCGVKYMVLRLSVKSKKYRG